MRIWCDAVSDAPLTTTEGLRLGDVVQIAVQLTDKQTGQPYWWKRFACVTWLPGLSPAGRARGHFRALTLKMRPEERDLRDIDLGEENQVVTKLDEDRWPQGVVAMRMKLITQGLVKLGE